jgi:hypothetical protein
MDYSDERYVRVYTRDTPTMKLLRWEGRMVLFELLRKVDRAGVIDFGEEGPVEAVAAVTDIPLEHVSVGLQRLLDRGCVVVKDRSIVVLKFLEAQESPQSDKHRQRESRAKRRDLARHGVTFRGTPDGTTGVTKRDGSDTKRDRPPTGATPPSVTKTVAPVTKTVASDGKPVETVTLSLAVPSRTVPDRSSKTVRSSQAEASPAGARDAPAAAAPTPDAGPVPPIRKQDLLGKNLMASEYTPMPEHEAYALSLGLGRTEYQAVLSDMLRKLEPRGYASPQRWDHRLTGFLESAAKSKPRPTNGSNPAVATPSRDKSAGFKGPISRRLFGDDDDEETRQA